MKKELQEKLYKEFPDLFSEKDLPMTETCMCWGICCDDGWFNLIRNLCLEISKADKDKKIKAVQVKEKFGGLRFYTNFYIEKIEDIIDKYEKKSLKTCESCGSTREVKLRGRGWIRTLCEDCSEKEKTK